MGKKLERKEMDLRSENGFTLLEVMSVLVILGVMFSVTIHRFTALSDTAHLKTLESGKRELNVQETLIWFDVKISTAGWQSDDDVFGQLDTQLGARYYWDPPADEIGGTLHFGAYSIVLTRIPPPTNRLAPGNSLNPNWAKRQLGLTLLFAARHSPIAF